MKKILLALPLLLLLVPVNGQVVLGVSNGDSFIFVLEEWVGEEDSGTTETVVTIEDVSNPSNVITFEEGDAFTITILDATPQKDEYGDHTIAVEYSANGATIESREWIGWGNFITEPDWDAYRAELESEASFTSDDSGFSESLEIIESDTEFGSIERFSGSYSDSDSSYTSDFTYQIVYEKSTGVIFGIKIDTSFTEVSSGQTVSEHFKVQLVRQGFSFGGDSDPGLSLPGWELAIIAPVLLSIVIIRRRK